MKEREREREKEREREGGRKREEPLVRAERRSITDPSLFSSHVRANRGDIATTYLHTHVMRVLRYPPRNHAKAAAKDFAVARRRAKDGSHLLIPYRFHFESTGNVFSKVCW